MTVAKHLRIATRKSPLALWQANHLAEKLRTVDPDLTFELVSMDTEADQDLSIAISELGGKGAFCKEIQQLVLAGRADVAVHSAKDLPTNEVDGLIVAGFCSRSDVRDVLVGTALEDIAEGGVVATGSNRRRALIADARPDIRFAELRGNIDTRLAKADQFDAIVMAAAALRRMGKTDKVDYLNPDVFVPQVGQGALALECRPDDEDLLKMLVHLSDTIITKTVRTERAFLAELGGDCDLPAGAYAQMSGRRQMAITGVLAPGPVTDTDRPPLFRETVKGSSIDIGRELAQRLRTKVEAA